jgi:uncharacterized protein YxeA
MAEPKTKQAFIVRDFKDTNFDEKGVERRFTKGAIETLPEGVYANYEHSGLVRVPNNDEIKKLAAPAA